MSVPKVVAVSLDHANPLSAMQRLGMTVRWLPLAVSLLLLGCGSPRDEASAPVSPPTLTDRIPTASEPPAARPLRSDPAPSPPSALPQTAMAGSPPRPEPAETFATIRVYYGTNRRPAGGTRPADRYGTDEGPLSYGFCDVSIPAHHRAGELESPRLWRLEVRENPQRHVVVLSVAPVPQPQFFSELQRTVWESLEWRSSPEGTTVMGGEAFVFVHGFNNTFEDAVRRTAQIAHDLQFRGAPIVYSWPSQGSATLRSYQEDGRLIRAAEQHFREFLTGVIRESGARRIHLLGHSMGNRLIAESLQQLADQFGSGRLPRLSQVVLTAPDIDADYFKTAIAPRVVQTAERITIYASQEDLALKASRLVNRLSPRRLGEGIDPETTFPAYRSIEVIDASAVATDLFSLRHAYHARNPTVLHDIAQVLRGLPPGERGLQALLETLAWRIREEREGVRPIGHTVVE